jgi:predicted MarR family transcription regulator
MAVLSRAGEEPVMIPFLVALAVACAAFWKAAVRILAAVVIFLVISGTVTVIQALHHLR